MLNLLERFYFVRGYWQKVGVVLDAEIAACPRCSFIRFVNSVLFVAFSFDTNCDSRT